jgi:L-ascorbate 6-phosphate lactonase
MTHDAGASGGPGTSTSSGPGITGSAIRLRWLGQAGFLLEGHGARVLVDPWFSDHELRVARAPSLSDLPGPIERVLASHGHEDHLDLAAIADLHRRDPSIAVVVPAPLVARVMEVAPGVRVDGVQPGDRIDDPALRIDVVPAWHGVVVSDGYSYGPHGQPTPHVGYVIHLGPIGVYHAGDTVVSAPLIDTLRDAQIDVALLPINGRDFFREADGILGNLDAVEAARFAAAIGARTLVPMHYEMVRGNTSTAGAVVDAVARLDLPVHVVVPTRAHPLDLFVGDA